MKTSYKYLAIAFATLLCSCNKGITPDVIESQVQISANITPCVITRITEDGASFTDGDAIKVQNVDRENKNLATYTYSESTGKWSTSEELYWDGEDANTFNAWYPATAAYDSFTIPADQTSGTTAADWMTATTAAKKADGTVNLSFNHNLAKVSVSIESWSNEYSADEKVANSLELNSLSSVMSYNGTLSGDNVAKWVKAYVTQANTSFVAIIAPATYAAGGNIMQIYVNGSSAPLAVKTSSVLTVESGKAYSFKLTVGKDLAEISSSVTIGEWDDEALENQEASSSDVPTEPSDPQDELYIAIDSDEQVKGFQAEGNSFGDARLSVFSSNAVEGQLSLSIPEDQSWLTVHLDKSETQENEWIAVATAAPNYSPEYREANVRIYITNDPSKEIYITYVQTQSDHYSYIDEYGVNHGIGVNVNGVIWAPVNCGYHATDYKYGKLYQWGRKYGQGYYDTNYQDADTNTKEGPVSLSDGQSASYSISFFYTYESPYDWVTPQDATLWKVNNYGSKTEYDPCPDGWRVPTYSELNNLVSITSLWTTNEGQYGRLFTGEDSYRIFLPAAGFLLGVSAQSMGRGSQGAYWSSEPGDNNAYAFLFNDQGVSIETDNSSEVSLYNRGNGYPVRCVQVQ